MKSTSPVTKLSKSRKERLRLLKAAKKNTGAWRCHLCGRVLNKDVATIDHLKPLSLNGTNSVQNIKLACNNCNGMRQSESIHFFKMKMLLLQNDCSVSHYCESFNKPIVSKQKHINIINQFKKHFNYKY